ncbi:MFS transporter [Parapedobacter pyrenivorans]|uniref:MFS transporter n=1 Tax=Parapedobacter pyrenivorans TaxID=1305674 RepID=A0A917HU77_9SPHI|nr:MFS transporter [Parapedobacter pyrenivorans]GGG90779.1 MFS transporter [Parapedobacter pyrenivorans]
MDRPMLSSAPSLHRIAIGAAFFSYGLCFASWASRIPDIKNTLQLSEGQLGMVLFALPIGTLISLPLAGWVIGRVGSKRIVVITAALYALLLVGIGYWDHSYGLIANLVLFGAAGNLLNISVNTQAVALGKHYEKPIMGAFHGMWSIAGFVGAGIGALMINSFIVPIHHFMIISSAALLGIFGIATYLISNDQPQQQKKESLFAIPDKPLAILGAIAFCAMIGEGALYDWCGIYMEEVVQVEKHLVGYGLSAFLFSMAAGRFLSDWTVRRFGAKTTLIFSGVLSSIGLLLSVIYPHFGMVIVAFLLVGIGSSAIIPLVYSLAGRSGRLSPGAALAAVTTIGFCGFLIGPPAIGLIAEFTGLRTAYALIASMGVFIVILTTKIRHTTS